MIKRGSFRILNRNTKAQYAMDFLMTWGWALILLAGVMGALFYFDIFSIMDMRPDRCTFSPGLICDEYAITEDSVSLKAINSMGMPITIHSSKLTVRDSGESCSWDPPAPPPIPAGVSVSAIDLDCGSDVFENQKGHKTLFDLEYEYEILGIRFNGTGEIFTTVGPGVTP